MRTLPAFAVLLMAIAVADAPPKVPDPQRVKARIAHDVEWYRANLVKAYEAGGSRNPKWDADAVAALNAVAAWSSRDPQRSGNEDEIAWRASSRAIRASCDDALVLYVRARMYHAIAQESAEENLRFHREAASTMEISKYAAPLKALAHMRAAEAIIEDAVARHASSAKGATQQLEAAKDLLPAIAASRDIPHPLVLEIIEGILDDDRILGSDRKEDFDSILPIFTKARSEKDPILPLLRADFLIGYAWDARSGKAAVNVPEKMMSVFLSRIDQANRELANAVALDPLSPSTAPLMMVVELAQGKGRERMESWFTYGLAVDPGNLDLYTAKLHYLEPRWNGSPEEMIAFGKQTAEGKQWALRVPMILVAAHEHLASQYDDPSDYFKENPAACGEIRSVYEPYLRSFPDAAYDRSRYALFLYQCGDYKGANEQFKILDGDGRIAPFGTRAVYENRRIDSAARAATKSP